MSLTNLMEHFLPHSLNEFETIFVRELYEKVTEKKIDNWQVSEAVSRVCGNKTGVCSRDKIGEVLKELERRETLQRRLLWDVRFLQGTDSALISPDNAFTLFKSYFGQSFGIKDWEEFMKGRSRSGPISFLELRNAVCNYVIKSEENNEDVESYLEELKKPSVQVKFSETQRERDTRRQRYRDMANSWLGDQKKKLLTTGSASTDMFISALHLKYKVLCKVALKQALEREAGEEAWLVKTEAEKEELISSLESRVETLRNMNRLQYCDHALNLKGLLTIKGGLYNVMGLHQLQSQIFANKMIKHRQKHFRAGKDESYVKEREMVEYSRKRKENEANSSNILFDLQRRLEEELELLTRIAPALLGLRLARKISIYDYLPKFHQINVELFLNCYDLIISQLEEELELLKKQLSGSSGRVWGARESDTMLALLYFHQYRATAETAFRPSVISVSLVEHVSPLPEERLFEDYDRWYDLARYRVTRVVFDDEYDSLTGLPLAPQSLPPVLALTAAQNALRECFVLLQRAHDAQCVYLQFLLYSDLDEEDHIKLLSSSPDELEDALAYIRQIRNDWRLRYDGVRDEEKLSEHYELLKKAMFIKVLLVQYKHDLLEDADSAMVVVMSELVQLQETEMAVLLAQILVKSADEVENMKQDLKKRAVSGYNDNVAHVLLSGVAEYDDNVLLETVNLKYEELKRVWIRELVEKQLSKGMSETELLIKERDLYAAGELYDAKNIFGDCVVHKAGLHGLMGPNREITVDTWVGEGQDIILFEEEPSDNILMDIQFRYKDDKAYLLGELKNSSTRLRIYEHSLLLYQIYILQEYNNFDAAASYVGVVEKVHIHPQYKLSQNWDILKRISEHVLCCNVEKQPPFQHVNLLSHSLFLEGTFRQVLRKTMIYLLQKKHQGEQRTFSYILNADSEKRGETIDVGIEESKLREIRSELGSGQIAGTFLASLQNKQLAVYQELVAHSDKDKTRLMSELLISEMDEAATCIADMLTMGKLELSVLVHAVRESITSGYNDNITRVLCEKDLVAECKLKLEKWFLAVLRKLLPSDKPGCQTLYKKLTNEQKNSETNTDNLESLGIELIPAAKRWGLLPSQFSVVLEAMETEKQLLKDDELSEEEMKVRTLEVYKTQTQLFYKKTSNLVSAIGNFRSEISHIMSNSTTKSTLTSLYISYGNILLDQQPLIPERVLFCYLSHLLRMMISPDHVTCDETIRDAARTFLAGYNKEWAEKTKLGSRGMFSLVRDYNNIHYNIRSYREYILSCLHKHHGMELSLFCSLLLDSGGEVEEAMSQADRVVEMKKLHDQWCRVQDALKAMTLFNDKSAEEISRLHEQQRTLLSTALSLKYGSVLKRVKYRAQSGNVTLEEARVELLSELLKHHIADIVDSIRSLHDMTMLELASLKITLHHNVKAGIVGSVAVVCFTPLLLDKDEQVAQELEDKYDKLKDKLYTEALMKQLGEKEWAMLSEKERQKKLLEMRRQAMKLKKEGKEDEMERLFADALANDKGMIEILGMSKEQYLKSLEEKRKRRKGTRKKVLEDGTEVEVEVEVDEEGNEVEGKVVSILDALDKNFESEKDALMKQLQNSGDQFSAARERQAMLVKLRLEKKRLDQQGTFDQAALILGQANTLGERQLSEKERQIALARARIAARKNKLQKSSSKTGLLLDNQDDIDIDTDDAGELQDILVELVHKKHEGEREVLQQLLDNLDPEQLQAVSSMSRKERQGEIGLLREDRRKWREEVAETVPSAEELSKQQAKQLEWLRQAAFLNLANVLTEISDVEYDMTIENEEERKEDFERRRKEEATVKMLALLQEKQDDEAAMLLGNIKHKGLSEIQGMCLKHKRAVTEGWMDNMAAVLLAKQAAANEAEQELVKELEKKYDNIKDKLILQMLEQQMGAEEWARLSEKDRQKKLMQTRLRERQLRAAGREEEADEIYKAMINVQKIREENEEDLKKRQKNRIKERLEYKRRRHQEGASKEEIEQELEEMKQKQEELDSANQESVSAKNMLASLMSSFDSEKDALLAQIRDGDGKIRSEKERQMALLKLKREQLRVKKDAEMDAAALVFGKAKAKDQQVKDARQHQLFLAKQRMLARKQKQQGEPEKEGSEAELEELKDISNAEDAVSTLQESIIHLIEQKHDSERNTFMNIVHKISSFEGISEEQLLEIKGQTKEENDARIVSLRRKRLRSLKSIKTANDQDEEEDRLMEFKDLQEAYLLDAVAVTLLSQLAQEQTETDKSTADKTEEKKKELKDQIEEKAVQLLATVQEQQEKESENLLISLNDMGVGQLSEVRQVVHGEISRSLLNNLCEVILGTPTQEDYTFKADVMLEVKTKRDKDLRAVMLKRREERRTRKEKNKADLAALLNNLNNETDKSVEEVTAQYEQYKSALDHLLGKKNLTNLTKEEEEMLAKIQDMMSKVDEGDGSAEDPLRGLTQDNRDELLNQLKRQHQSQLQQINAQREAQKKAMLAKMRVKVAVKDKKEVEEDHMRSIFGDFERSQTIVRNKSMTGQSAAKEKLAGILAKKKEAAQLAAKKREEAKRKQEEEKKAEERRKSMEESSLPSTPSSTERPGDRLLGSREGSRTSRVEISGQLGDSDKKELLDSLVRQATSAEVSKSRQRDKQAEQLRARIRARQMAGGSAGGIKRDKVQEEAEEILGAMERDKTQLDFVHNQELTRQKTIIRERIKRIREKTVSGAAAESSRPPPGPGTLKRQQSDLGMSSHLTAEEQKLPKSEQMQLVAARMQDKFKKSAAGEQGLAALREDENLQ